MLTCQFKLLHTQKPLKTVLIEEIGSGSSPAVDKDPLPTKTSSTAKKDDTLKQLTGIINSIAVTSTSKSITVEILGDHFVSP